MKILLAAIALAATAAVTCTCMWLWTGYIRPWWRRRHAAPLPAGERLVTPDEAAQLRAMYTRTSGRP